MELNDFLALVAQSLLIIALPIVIAAAVQHYRVQSDKLKEKLSDEKFDFLKQAASIAVKAAEQTGVIEALTGPEKRQMAIEIAQDFLDERGIRIDVASIAAVIEAEVKEQFNNPQMPADTPESRQALLQQAAENAVQAAEESGLKGAIEDIGEQKKAYAIHMVIKQLQEYGIEVNPDVISGLIDAEVLKQFTQPQDRPLTSMEKSELIDQAVERGVLAAEQSGEKGLIENTGAIKKSYAMHLAKEFLATYNITVNDTLLSGLIEAYLAKLR